MFSLGLYKEGLRRTMLLSVLFIITMMLGAVLIPIANIISQIRTIESGLHYSPIIVSGFGDNIVLFIAMIAFAPILTLYLFSFLNKRNSSDFYHSTPHKRETLFVSFTASILTWVLGGIWLCTAITLGIYSFFGAYVLLNITAVFLATLGLSVSCMLVIGATLIAMSITGNTFANITVAFLILFLPRILLTVFISIIVQTTRVVSPENFGIFGNNLYNIPFGFIMSIFNQSLRLFNQPLHSIEEVFIQGILYTTMLGLVYLGIGLVLFKKRKSEAAQSPALNRFIQATIRIALAFVVCIPAIGTVIFMTQFEDSISSRDLLSIFTFYTLAVIAYFAYELITTKKLASIIKALPGLGLLVLLNIVFITGIVFTQNAILDRNFEVNEIASVQILSLDHNFGFFGLTPHWTNLNFSYEQHQAREVKIQDEELTIVLLESLTENIAKSRKRSFINIFDNTWQITVLFETTPGQTIRRNFLLSENAFLATTQILSQYKKYMVALLTLPETPAEIRTTENLSLSEEALWDIYETLREEVLDLDLVALQRISNPFSYIHHRGLHSPLFMDDASYLEEDIIAYYGTISVLGFLGRYTYRNSYSITNLTPRTAEAFIQHTNAQNFENVVYVLEHALEQNFLHPLIMISGYNISPYGNSVGVHNVNLDVVRVLLDAIREQRDIPVDLELVHYSIEPRNFQSPGRFFFNSDNEKLLEFLEMRQRQRWYWR